MFFKPPARDAGEHEAGGGRMADDALVDPAEGIAVKTAQRVRRDNPQSDFVRYQDEGRFRVFSDDREELIQLWGENGIRVFFGSDFRERDHDIGAQTETQSIMTP